MKRTYLPIDSADEVDVLPSNCVHVIWHGSDGTLNASCFYSKEDGSLISSMVRPDFLAPRTAKGFVRKVKAYQNRR